MTTLLREPPVQVSVAERTNEARRRVDRQRNAGGARQRIAERQPESETAMRREDYDLERVPVTPPARPTEPAVEETTGDQPLPAPAPGVTAEQVAAREAQAAEARGALESAQDSSGVMNAFAQAPPTLKAELSGVLGERISSAEAQETQALQQNTPEIQVEMMPNTPPPSGEIPAPAVGEIVLEPAPAPAPAAESLVGEPVTTSTDYNANSQVVSGLRNNFNPGSGAASVDNALNSVQTTDPTIVTSPGTAPGVPQSGETDPQRFENQVAEGARLSQEALAQQQQAVATLPGVERVQLADVHESRQVGELVAPTAEQAPAPEGAQQYLQMHQPVEVQTAFDDIAGAQMQQSMAEAQSQMQQAADQRDLQHREEVDRAQQQTAEAQRQADEDQRSQVASTRQEIEQQRQSTHEQQQAAVADVQQQSEARSQADRNQFDERVRTDQEQIDNRYNQAERDAQAEVQRGEQQAEAERRRSEREAESQSWWEAALDFVADLFDALVAVINSIFDAVRAAVNTILNAVRDFALGLIDLAVGFLTSLVERFGQFLKGLVQALLADIFPDLARALLSLIDRAVALATRAINAIAQTLRTAVNAIVETLRAGINAIINTFQAGVNAALALARAALTGDWQAFIMQLLEAACRVAGIDPQQVYNFIGRVQETIRIIIDNPGQFLSNVVDALLGGFRRFGENFLAHLQAGIIGWLTGALGTAGIQLPERFDLMGVISLVAQILGLTWQNLRQRLVRMVGERGVQVLEFVAGYIQALIQGGWSGLWERIQSDLSSLRDMVLQGIRDFLVQRVIMAAVTRLATMFNPVGALVNILIAVYNFYTFIRDQIQRIAQVVTTIVDAVGNIAHGILGAAQERIESFLAGLLPLAIDLLARLIGLGNIGERVRAILERVQDMIWGAIDRLIARVVSLFRGGGSAGQPGAAAGGAAQIGETISIPAGRETHSLYIVARDKDAVLMLASEPRPLQSVLQNWRSQLNTLEAEPAQRAERLINAAERELGGVDRSADEALLRAAAESPARPGSRPVPRRDDSGLISGEERLAANLRELYPLFNRDASTVAQRFERALSYDPFHQFFNSQLWVDFFTSINMPIELRTAQSDLQWGRENNRLDVQPGGRPQYRLRISDDDLVSQAVRIVAGDGRFIGVVRAGKRVFGLIHVRQFCIEHERLPNDSNRYTPEVMQRISELLVRRGDVQRDQNGYVMTDIPSIRTLPEAWTGDDTRNQLYINGSGFDTAAERIRVNKLPEIRDAVNLLVQPQVTPAQRNQGMNIWISLRTQLVVPNEPFDPGNRAEYLSRGSYDVDHIIPLAQHWTNQGGNNTDEHERQRIAAGTNLRLLWAVINRSRQAEGARYARTVGQNFESQYTRGIAQGFKFIQPGLRFKEYELET